MIQSPLNYTGGKYKLLPQIMPLFPEKISTFVDLFCGGGNVGINVKSDLVIYNDTNRDIICLFNTFKNLDSDSIIEWVYQIIDKYGLSLSSEHGYEHYDCKSDKGLGEYNRERFLKLRTDFNQKTLAEEYDYYYYVMLYVLIVYAFNNQIRFNSKGEFNLPVGKRDFNESMHKKLIEFVEQLKLQKCKFTLGDFRTFDISELSSNDFVYADPPYLITCATYNEQNGWNKNDEIDLLSFLDTLGGRQIKFALSNVLRSKGKENSILIDWLNSNANRYRAIPLDYSYSNSNYHTKDKQTGSDEVLIINY